MTFLARMIPPYLAEDIKSTGERYIFDLLKNDPATSDWIVIHSLGLKRHVRKPEGEIDFVVLVPDKGVFSLEVKSGQVTCRDGVWTFTNRYGEANTKVRGPFEQVREAMYSLRNQVIEKFGKKHRLTHILFGYGVLFPHMVYNDDSVEYETWMVYDKDSRRYPISKYITGLAKHFLSKMNEYQWFDENASKPSKKEIDELVKFFRGNYEKFVSRQALIDDMEYLLNKFTEEQCSCLDQLGDNPRCLFVGSAGTGKTILALEAARRALSEGKRTLVLSFNTLLAARIRYELQDVSGHLLFAGSFHQYLVRISGESSHSSDDPEYFPYTLPIKALDSIDKGIVELAEILIVDEAQDLITPEYLDVMDSLLIGGLSGGNWSMFADFERQAIYSKLTREQLILLIYERSSFIQFKLTTNCRNSKSIVRETSLVCGFHPPKVLDVIEGVPVNYSFYNDNQNQVEKIVEIIKHLRDNGISNSKIIVLSPNRLENSCISLMKAYKVTVATPENFDNCGPNELLFSTIHAYKGLECSNVILCDVNRLDNQMYKQLLYIGMSRARVGLYIFAHESSRSYYQSLLKEALHS